MARGLLGGVFSGVAPIDKGDLHLITGGFLHRLSQFGNLGAILLVGGRDLEGEQMAQRITAACTLEPFLRL